ncbi:MFS transporter [Vogesella sp. LIG4]|uniref:MFS transporter n=1 Tax=Vogesella sp. LIG4 TaxID=1192162 RepID=UPI0008200F1F|nr:MFS transporter [Vogesella sp. LIG4]SCK28283.1 drug resistance transporter, EmrB/QacA subfamily [Vogesella sp. LIG4]
MHTPDNPVPASSAGERRALLSLSLTMLLSSLGTSIANVALPTLITVFSASFQQVQWVVLSYLLAITTLIVSAGRLGDMFGRRPLLLGGVGLFTLASLLCSYPSLPLLIAARAMQGLGAALMMALSMAYVADIVPRERTGRAMGLLGTASAIGTAMGPSLGGLLIGSLGWQAIFAANVLLGLAVFCLLQRHLPAPATPRRAARSGYDYVGTALLSITLGAYALAMTLGRGDWGLRNNVLLGLALLAAALFVISQQRASAPLIKLSLLARPLLVAALVMSALVTSVVMATLVVGPFYLTHALGLSTTQLGLVMSAGPLVAACSGVPAGHLVDRFGARPMTLSGLLLMLAGSSGLALQPVTSGVPGYVLAIMITTAGYALFQAANNTQVMAGVAAEQRGLVSGLLNLSRNLGLITGTAAMGAVFAMASKAVALTASQPQATGSGMHITFAVAVLLIVLALLVGLRSRAPQMQTV